MSALWLYLLIAVCLPGGSYEWRPTQCGKPSIDNLESLSEDKEYYNKSESVTVRCKPGYYPSSDTMRCNRPGTWREWVPYVTCLAQCGKPSIDNLESLSEDKEYYKRYERVTVRCKPGYYPSSDTMKCILPGSPSEWTPSDVTCLARSTEPCTRPTIENVERFSEDKESYERYEVVTIWCQSGYYPESATMTCMSPGASREWTPTATCKAQCKRPTIANVGRLLADQKYYDRREVLSIICNPGYYPSSDTMRCDNPGTPQEWTPPTVTCTGRCKRPVIEGLLNPHPFKISYKEGDEVTIHCLSGLYPSNDITRCEHPLTPQEWTPAITCMDITVRERVTSSSASFWMSCTPRCPHHWRFDVTCCDFHFGLCTTLNASSHVTFSGLQPSSQYRVTITLLNNRTKYDLKARLIWTEKSAPGQFDIVDFPTMQDGTIRWSMPHGWRNVAGFQMNIAARRDYDQSFGMYDSIQFPPNVTEYKIPLQYGTNYTITLRGFTSAGDETTREWFTRTKIGDPPRHPENTLGEKAMLQLTSVPAVNGPISSYEIIVYLGQKTNLSVDCLSFQNTPYSSSLDRYTAAVLAAETLTGPRTFILGDNQHYNGFHNAPLTPGHNYSVYIRVTSRWNEVEKSSCAFAGVI